MDHRSATGPRGMKSNTLYRKEMTGQKSSESQKTKAERSDEGKKETERMIESKREVDRWGLLDIQIRGLIRHGTLEDSGTAKARNSYSYTSCFAPLIFNELSQTLCLTTT